MRFFIAALLATLSLTASAVDFQIAADRMAVVDGKRTFVLGLYENPKEDTVLQAVKEAGFNLVHATAEEAALDRLHELGLWAWINTGYAIDFSEEPEARAAQLDKMVAEYAAHPAMLVWEVPDEALWNVWYGAVTWRWHTEPGQLIEAINAVADEAQRTELRAQRDESIRLRGQGYYAESEALADAIWESLGKEPPQPTLNFSNAAERAAKMAKGMVAGYERLREIDPHHPVWMNHAPRNSIAQLAVFNAGADIVGCDIYPLPVGPSVGHSDLMDKTMTSVGAYTRRMQEAAPGKPVWMVLQGFGWDDIQENGEKEGELGRPTREQTRFMAYDTIVNGARGILYWGTMAVEKDSPFFADLLSVVKERSGLQPVLSAPDADLELAITLEETSGSIDRGIRVLPKQVGDQLWLIVVNEWTEPLSYTIGGLGNAAGQSFVVHGAEDSGPRPTLRDDALHFTIPPQSVQILAPGE
ncbi:MAG: hypothetical protein IT368_18685 [Candidatus Hydrogenedentes bacterium]|nr:hypothetical protein [Candidatus Hydrogenedentota bacterium]